MTARRLGLVVLVATLLVADLSAQSTRKNWQKGRDELRAGRDAVALQHFEAGMRAGEGVEATLGVLGLRIRFGDQAGAQEVLSRVDRQAVDPERWQDLGREFVDKLGEPLAARSEWANLGALCEVALAVGWRGNVLSRLRFRAALGLGDHSTARDALEELLLAEAEAGGEAGLAQRNGVLAARLGRALDAAGEPQALRYLQVAGERGSLTEADEDRIAALQRSRDQAAGEMLRRLAASRDPDLAKKALRRFGKNAAVRKLAMQVLGVERRPAPTPEAVPTGLPAEEIRARIASIAASLDGWRTDEAEKALRDAEAAGVPAGRLTELQERYRTAAGLKAEVLTAQQQLKSGDHVSEAAGVLLRAHGAGYPGIGDDLGRVLLLAGRAGEALPLLRRRFAEKPDSGTRREQLAEAEAAAGAGTAGALRAAGLYWEGGRVGKALTVLLPPLAPALVLGLLLLLIPVAGAFMLLGRKQGQGVAVQARRERRAEEEALDAERARLEDERDRAVKKAVAFSHVAQQVKLISTALRREDVVAALVESVTHCLSTNSMQIWSADLERRVLVPVHHAACKAPAEEPLDPRSPFGWMYVNQRTLDRREIERTPTLAGLRDASSVKLGIGMPVVPSHVPGLVLNLPDVDPDRLEASDLVVLQALASVTALALQNSELFREREEERDRFAEEAQKSQALLKKVVSPEVADRMMELTRSGQGSFDSKKMNLTVLFSDIRGFTTLSERLEPEEVVSSLNDYLGEMTRIVFENQGTLDKYWGDALVAYFGAPVEYAEHAQWAVRAAESMQRRLWEMTVGWAKRGLPVYEMGIGIATGPVVWGAIGSEAQMSYTVIGDTVNLAARLQSNAMAGQILVSKGTVEALEGRGPLKALPPMKVKGKADAVEVFEWQVGEAGAKPAP